MHGPVSRYLSSHLVVKEADHGDDDKKDEDEVVVEHLETGSGVSL